MNEGMTKVFYMKVNQFTKLIKKVTSAHTNALKFIYKNKTLLWLKMFFFYLLFNFFIVFFKCVCWCHAHTIYVSSSWLPSGQREFFSKRI